MSMKNKLKNISLYSTVKIIMIRGRVTMVENQDSSLIEEILKGNKDRFEVVVNKYGDYVFGYIFKQVKDRNVAEEIVQNTFIKAFRNLGNFDRHKPFLPWILKIARNDLMDYYRRESKRNAVNIDENFQNIIDKNSEPIRILEEKERLREIDNIINSMNYKYRVLIILKYFQGMSYEEISKELNISVGKVKWRLYEARKLFIREYGKFNLVEGSELYEMQKN